MKQVGFLSFGLAAAIAIIFCSRKQALIAPPVSLGVAARVSSTVSVVRLGDSSPRQPSASALESTSRYPLDATLASIRMRLAQLSETAKADKGTEDELMTGLMTLLTDDNVGEIVRTLSTDELHSRFGLAALQHWLKVAPLTAADWVAARSDSSDEQAWAVAHQMVEDKAALDLYCARLPVTEWRQMFLKQAALEATRRDPAEAIQLAQRIDSGCAQLDLLQTTICTWMIDDPTAAAKWVAQVRDPLLREELICTGAKTLAARDAPGAIDWLLTSLPAPSEGSEPSTNETLQDIVGTWAEAAPTQAARMVAQFPQGSLREATVKLVWDRWVQRDPAAAADWLKALPERDRILATAGID